MKFIADLHLHSKFSRATSRDMMFDTMAWWAKVKGVSVLATADFTHPEWFFLTKEKLEPAGNGFFRLKAPQLPDSEYLRTVPFVPDDVAFVLSTELSFIYSKKGKVRKVHLLLLAPDFESVETINGRLSGLGGNLRSDGRPILGMDARIFVKMVADLCPKCAVIPAHIWTPWFSLFGANSGFDAIEECFEEQTPFIFALETGLSSDPPMNRRLSALDSYALISNSDAHSPSKIGREANAFEADFSYPGLLEAIRSKDPDRFLNTIEFFPEQGKYHFDGHRKCRVMFSPKESLAHNDLCPVCGKRLTIGVLHRVEELADREEIRDAPHRVPYKNLIPLNEIIGEAGGTSADCRSVWDTYFRFIREFGNEQRILTDVPIADLCRLGPDAVGQGVERMRKGLVKIVPGHDGEYGTIRLFDPAADAEDTGIRRMARFAHLTRPTPLSYNKQVKKKYILLVLIALIAAAVLLPAQTRKKTAKDLPPQYRKWLEEEAVYIITGKERDVFLQLESDRERNIFIEAFWKQRNPDPGSTENKFRVEHYRRIAYVNQWFGRNSPTRGWRTDMGRIYIILGEPKAKEVYENDPQLRPFIMWFYDGMSEYGLPGSFYVAFWKKDIVDDYRLYSPINDGPQNLLIHYAGDMAQHEEAYRQLLQISPNVAEVSLSLIPGESRFSTAPSMASEILIRQNIPKAPQEKVKDEYAEKLLKYKNIIEVDYTSNYIDNDAMIQVFQDPTGLSFVHYLIEPRRLTFEQTQRGAYRSQLEINGRITDAQGRSIYQFDRTIPLQISEDQMTQIRTRIFSLQDLFPMSPGQYKVNLLVKNTISKEFTSVEADLLIPEPAAFSMSAPILAYRADKDSKFKGSNKPFLLGNVQFVPSPRNVFMPSDTMFLFFQLHGLPNELRAGGSVVYTIFKQNETMKIPEPVKTIARDLKDMPDPRAVIEEFPLAALPAAHYILSVAVHDAGKAEKLKAQIPFDIRGALSLNRAWVVSLPQPPSDDPSFANILGAQHLAKQDLAKARPLLESAYRRDPGSLKYALDYSRALAEAKDFRGVVEVARPYLTDERKYDFLQLAGDASRELGLYAEAIARYKDYLAHFGTNVAVLNAIGECYLKLDNTAEALVAWERSIQLEPNQPALKERIKALKDKK